MAREPQPGSRSGDRQHQRLRKELRAAQERLASPDKKPYPSSGLMVGTQLGQYRILALLGRGGMGDVYLAEDTTLGRKIALKMLPAWLAARGIDRLNHEARALAALDHPNIVRVFSVERADGVSFLTMPFVRGRTFADVQTAGGLALERFFAIAIPLVDAVAAAHQAGLIHRDLKPGNVMIGDDDHVTVLDFGLAKLTEAPAEGLARLPTVTATADGQVKGTVAYMSPEQAEGKAIDTRRSDGDRDLLAHYATDGDQAAASPLFRYELVP